MTILAFIVVFVAVFLIGGLAGFLLCAMMCAAGSADRDAEYLREIRLREKAAADTAGDERPIVQQWNEVE
jgi:polyferredoxin